MEEILNGKQKVISFFSVKQYQCLQHFAKKKKKYPLNFLLFYANRRILLGVMRNMKVKYRAVNNGLQVQDNKPKHRDVVKKQKWLR